MHAKPSTVYQIIHHVKLWKVAETAFVHRVVQLMFHKINYDITAIIMQPIYKKCRLQLTA